MKSVLLLVLLFIRDSLRKTHRFLARFSLPKWGKVIELQQVSGLHHRYERRAA